MKRSLGLISNRSFSPTSTCQRSSNFSTNIDETDDNGSKQRDRDEMSSSSASSVTSSSPALTTSASGSGGGDGILVDLLETEVDSLKAQLEKTQNDLVTQQIKSLSYVIWIAKKVTKLLVWLLLVRSLLSINITLCEGCLVFCYFIESMKLEDWG